MINEPNPPKKRRSKLGLILISVIILILGAAFIFYLNINKMLAAALHNVFESSQVADVYEMSFRNLRANPIDGDISVLDVTFQLRDKPRKSYPYINSSITLKTDKLILENVDIFLLLRSNILKLEKVAIIRPDLELNVNGYNPIFFPFMDYPDSASVGENKLPDSYFLEAFELRDAAFRLINPLRKREFSIENFSVSVKDVLLDKNDLEDLFFLKEMEISLKTFTGEMEEDPLQHLGFTDFKIKFDSVIAKKNLDTLIFQFRDFSSEVNNLDIQTRDSLFHITMGSFDLSYLDQAILLEQLSFKPNVSNAIIQKNYKFQHTQFSGTVGKIAIEGVNFDSLIHSSKLFVENVVLDSISALIYKDNTKARDLNHFPEYLGQTIMGITNPVRIKTLSATNVNLINEERKPDGSMARVKVNRGTLEASNITNLAPSETLILKSEAYLEDRVPFRLDLEFSYSQYQFTFSGLMKKFELAQINQIMEAYTPANFTAGIADEIKFSGVAKRTSSTGNLSFLYHDLKVNLELEDKAKWKSDILTFGANTALNTNNPASPNMPPREVKFKADRDMNRGFINLIIKSILDGMRETMFLSKENRRDFNQTKREARKEARKTN
ncbi:hypothetical protein [Algoriphagus sp.]|uniref:hypothetical protein n=1 Tax=Algoriphagus sp. TaxID=1872435 RepID=UPI003919087C